MPHFDYTCDKCGLVAKDMRKPEDGDGYVWRLFCEACWEPMRKLPSAPALKFKGKGWQTPKPKEE